MDNNQTPNSVNRLSDLLLKLDAIDFTLVATIIGYVIGIGQSSLAQSSLGNFFEQVGQTLETLGSQNSFLEGDKLTREEHYRRIYEITKRIENIETIINKFKDL